MNDTIIGDGELEPVDPDSVLPFAVPGLDIRGRTVRLGPLLDSILLRHAYPPAVSRLLGEAMALTALLGTAMKIDGRFQLQTSTDGPVSMIVVDYRVPEAIRPYARFDADAVAAAERDGRATPADLLGHGHLAMTVDPGAGMQRYQGVVALSGQSLEDVAHDYFAQSEQIPTRVRLAVAETMIRNGDGAKAGWQAGGILIQFLPDSPERLRRGDLHPGDAPDGAATTGEVEDDAWLEARSLVETVEDHELTDPGLALETLLFRLYHERGVRVFSPQPLIDRCGCSRDRVAEMLARFQPEERAEMIVDGEIVVTCEFCSSHYHFDPTQFTVPSDQN
ncbi:MAG: Hsp33 family molecular chaperone [Hyphomicrobiales bacterium]|nr:MAG: Hsp33 family molecular chaperone [Hyphomicrobiales bacterium]